MDSDKKRILIIFIFLCLIPAVIFSNILKVNQTSGPYFAVTNALKVAVPGDIIEITDNGIYSENIIISINSITLRGAQGYKPTIQNNGAMNTFEINYVSNVYIENLIVKNNNDMNVFYINGTPFVRIQNCEIDGSGSTSPMTGIYLYESFDSWIINCRIHNFNSGIYLYSLGATNTAHIFYNEIYSCTNGIKLEFFEGDQFVYNNTLVKNDKGIVVGDPYLSSGHNVNIKNNISYFNNNLDLFFSGTTLSYNVNISYNCFSSLSNSSPGMVFITEQNNISQDPLFVDFNADNFHLLSDSPCIDAGGYINYTMYGLSFAINGSARDIGANEYSDSTATVPSAQPGVDSMLRINRNNFSPPEEIEIFFTELSTISENDPVYIVAKIFDLRGRMVKKIYEGYATPQDTIMRTWDGKDESDNYLGAGLYILKVIINNAIVTEKIFFIP